MKIQQFELPGHVNAIVRVYKIHPWAKLGHPELETPEHTNSFLMQQIGNEVANVIRESVNGQLDMATAHWRVIQALNSIGYWPNPRVSPSKRDSQANAWIEGMLTTSIDSALSFRRF